MKKKILFGSILVVFMLLTITYVSTINAGIISKSKESPLYRIRTKGAIGERLGRIIDFIKTRFLGERIFFLPIQWILKIIKNENNKSWEEACPK